MALNVFAVTTAVALALATLASAKAAEPLAVLSLIDVPGVGLTIEATVDGQPGRFLFDTGWGVSAITPAVAAAIRCKPWGQVTGYRAIGERLDSKRCNAASFRIGGVRANAPEVIVVDIMKYMPAGTAPLSGGVGLDLFSGRTLTIQSHAHRVVLESDASRGDRIRTALEVSVRPVRDAQGAALTMDIAIPTADGDAWMELDTGNNGPTMVASSIAELLALKTNVETAQPLVVTVRPGVVVRDKAIVRDLILDGDIGRGFLDRWDLTLDLAAGKAWLAPAAD